MLHTAFAFPIVSILWRQPVCRKRCLLYGITSFNAADYRLGRHSWFTEEVEELVPLQFSWQYSLGQRCMPRLDRMRNAISVNNWVRLDASITGIMTLRRCYQISLFTWCWIVSVRRILNTVLPYWLKKDGLCSSMPQKESMLR